MKKTILIVVAVVLLLCLANPFVVAAPQEPEETEPTSTPLVPEETVPPEPTPTPIYFADVRPADWYFECIQGLHAMGLASGMGNGFYEPDNEVTWAEVLVFLLRGMGVDPDDPEPGQKWADVYVGPALENYLIDSTWDTELLYTPINRLDAAHLTARALGLIPISGPSPFIDCDEPDVTELYEKGILSGVPQADGTLAFLPDSIFTRAEMSSILWKSQTVDYTKDLVQIQSRWVDVFPNLLLNQYSAGDFINTVDGVQVTEPPEGEEAVKDPRTRVTYTGGYSATGIDVSEFLGEIDWEKVKADGIDFVMIRIGGRLMQSGTIFEDKYFKAYLEGAQKAGLDVGVYFFSQALNEQEGMEEAEFVLDLLDGVTLTYPVVCDWEFLGGATCRTWTSTPREVTDGIDAFCRKVEEAGYRAGVYFNEYCGILKMDLSRLSAYPFWFAQYSDAPTFLYNFQMWQFSGGGKVDGINSEVDINLCFVEDLYAPVPTPEPPAETEAPDASANPDATPEADPNASEAPAESSDDAESSTGDPENALESASPGAEPSPENTDDPASTPTPNLDTL